MLYKEIDGKARELRGATSELENDIKRKTDLTKELRKEKKKVKPLEERERKRLKFKLVSYACIYKTTYLRLNYLPTCLKSDLVSTCRKC